MLLYLFFSQRKRVFRLGSNRQSKHSLSLHLWALTLQKQSIESASNGTIQVLKYATVNRQSAQVRSKCKSYTTVGLVTVIAKNSEVEVILYGCKRCHPCSAVSLTAALICDQSCKTTLILACWFKWATWRGRMSTTHAHSDNLIFYCTITLCTAAPCTKG